MTDEERMARLERDLEAHYGPKKELTEEQKKEFKIFMEGLIKDGIERQKRLREQLLATGDLIQPMTPSTPEKP